MVLTGAVTTKEQPVSSLSSAGQKLGRETLEERLKQRQAQIAARLQNIAAKRKAENRERCARLDRIIGAACRADQTMHERIKTALKGVKAPADREFLKIEGWL